MSARVYSFFFRTFARMCKGETAWLPTQPNNEPIKIK